MRQEIQSPEDLNHEESARLIIDYLHRIMMHHAMWYAEVRHQLGRDKAEQVLAKAYEQSYGIQMKRLAKTLGFEMVGDIPQPLLNLSDKVLEDLKQNIAVNWLANDGVWFQAVEFSRGMFDAKRCNDSCWVYFSPFEAWSIRRFLNLSPRSGLEGLKKALRFRLYATINKQSIIEESPQSFVFQMTDCRVQSTRKRKGLDDYPCKSAGVVEYPGFAEAIDPRIKTECVGCPPDAHPGEWYCSWRFTIEE